MASQMVKQIREQVGEISGQVDKGGHVVKLATVDMWRVRPNQKQKERSGHLAARTHTWTESGGLAGQPEPTDPGGRVYCLLNISINYAIFLFGKISL